MITKIKYCIVCLLCCTSFHLQADTPKYSNEFLALGIGARALGMSNSVIASVSDATSVFWNPAGLSLIPSNIQIGLMHSERFAGIISHDFASIASKANNSSAIGFGMIRMGVDDILDTTDLIDNTGNINYDNIRTFSVADYAFLFSYARQHSKPGLRYGANFKIIHRIVGEFATAWGFGIDVGAQYDHNDWQFGVMGKDITSTFNAWKINTDLLREVYTKTGNDIPKNSIEVTLPKVIAGVSRSFAVDDKINGRVEANLDFTFDGKRNVLISGKLASIEPHMGIEMDYKKTIYLRAGIGNIQKETDIDNKEITTFQPNLGVGLKLNKITLDYALTDIGNQSAALYSNIFSLKIDIARKEKSD